METVLVTNFLPITQNQVAVIVVLVLFNYYFGTRVDVAVFFVSGNDIGGDYQCIKHLILLPTLCNQVNYSNAYDYGATIAYARQITKGVHQMVISL